MKEAISKSYLEQTKSQHKEALVKMPESRRFIVVGAGIKNIGSAIAVRLSRDGQVYCPYLNMLDVTDPDKIKSYLTHYHVDTLILSHGVTHLDWFEDQPLGKAEEIIDVNLTGTIRVIQEFVKQTINDPWRKHIVSIGSMAYKSVLNGSAVYCASKAGLAHLIKCLAWELAPKGYDLFSVHPSNTKGAPMSEHTVQELRRYRGLTREEAEAYWGAVLPKGEWLLPEDIAETVAYLVSGKASYLSGSNIDMAGGQR